MVWVCLDFKSQLEFVEGSEGGLEFRVGCIFFEHQLGELILKRSNAVPPKGLGEGFGGFQGSLRRGSWHPARSLGRFGR